MISSGDVSDYETGPNTSPSTTTVYGVSATPAQEALLDPITGGSLNHNDVTQIDITFDMLPGFDTVFFNVTFGSEEYDEFVGSSFIDAFGLYVNGTNIAQVNGDPVNIDHPDMLFLGGTELDGILGGDGHDREPSRRVRRVEFLEHRDLLAARRAPGCPRRRRRSPGCRRRRGRAHG